MAVPSAEYWAKRAQARLVEIERGSEKYLQHLHITNARVARQIRNDIDIILGNFAKNSNLTREEAIAILNEPITQAEYEQLLAIARQITDPVERARLMARVNAPAYKARIDRLSAIEAQTQARVAASIPGQTETIANSLLEAGREMYNRTMFDLQRGTGLAFSFTNVSEKQLEAVLRHRWSGLHYSKRIWKSPEIVAKQVRDIVQQNMVSGRSWRRSLNEIQSEALFTGNYTQARLLRTETAYVAAELEAEAYEEAELEEYKYVATLDTRTSTVCQGLDGKKFKLKDRKTGINYPPMHPHCRSTTVAVVEGTDESQLKRRARNPETGKTELVPADMTYPEWKEMHDLARATRPKNIVKADTKLQKTLADPRISGVIPKNVDLTNVKVLAGTGVRPVLRCEKNLIKEYGGRQGEWQKVTADVITDNFKYQVHYYERNSVQYKSKLKNRKGIRK